jgi:hypothetical protein
MDLNRDTALKGVPLLDTQEPHRLTSLNMAVCLHKLDLNQPARCPLSNLQANFLVNKVAMADLPPNLQLNMPVSKWDMVALPVLVAMAVVSRHRMLNGVLLQLRALATASVAIRASASCSIISELGCQHCRYAWILGGLFRVINLGSACFLSASVPLCAGVISHSARPICMVHRPFLFQDALSITNFCVQ